MRGFKVVSQRVNAFDMAIDANVALRGTSLPFGTQLHDGIPDELAQQEASASRAAS